MNHLFFKWNKIKDMLKDRFVFLFLDYDGTLTPIVRDPDRAIIPQKTLETLKSLSKNKFCRIAIISGRALKDIKNKVGIEGVIYAGNHGFEIKGPKIKFKILVSMKYKLILRKIKSILKKKLSKIKGAIVEDKGLALSVHYRLVDKKDARLVKRAFREVLAYYIARNKIKVKPGKKVMEIRPPLEWDKGKIVLWLLARRDLLRSLSPSGFGMRGRERYKKTPRLVIYIGDDVSDEDAFRVLKKTGLTVFVGNPINSHAKYYLRNTDEVTEFLEEILKIKKDG